MAIICQEKTQWFEYIQNVLTGDTLFSKKCDCGSQLSSALEAISNNKSGVLLYMRGHEGRGIGLGNKIKAYSLQDDGEDTVDANLKLGFKNDQRDYGTGALILRNLGITNMNLLTNNPSKRAGLEGYGLNITKRTPLLGKQTPENSKYLETKKIKWVMISMKSNVAIVVSDYYEDISSGLVDGFTKSLDPKFTIDTHYVTGAWEIIHKINSLTDKYDKFVAIGAIIKGGTDHYEYISQGVIDGLNKIDD